MTANKEDARYDHTETDLMEAFQILARKKDPGRITVAEITRLTGIARSTFYNHYVDMPSLIDAVENRIIDEIFELMIHFHPQNQEEICRHFYQSLCQYIQGNGFLIRMLAGPLASDFIAKALAMFHRYIGSVLSESAENSWEYTGVLAYSIGGVVGVLHRWALDGCQEAPETMASLLSRLFFRGVQALLPSPAASAADPPAGEQLPDNPSALREASPVNAPDFS